MKKGGNFIIYLYKKGKIRLIFYYKALRDMFCFAFLSGNARKIFTLTKKAGRERITCYDKLHPGVEGGRIAELPIRTFSPHF